MSEAFDFAKNQARRHIAEQQGKSTHSIHYGISDVPIDYELIALNLPVDNEFQIPLRDPITGRRRIIAGYNGAGDGPAGG